MWLVNEMLVLLKDGKWHNLEEIARNLRSNEIKTQIVVRFLSSYDFIEFDEKRHQVKLRPLILEFVDEIQHISEEGAVKTLGL